MDRDQENCPNVGLVAIGDATDAPPEVFAAAPRFRAMAAAELTKAHLVCAEPMTRWRDNVVVQRLKVDGVDDGVLAGGLGPEGPVVRMSVTEWTSFDFRAGGPTDHNFAGVPVGRVQVGGYEIIRTTQGGIVMERPDSWGFVVINGAWDVWMAHGGPAGDMGLPTSAPNGNFRSVEDGDLRYGARQDFERGYVFVPGVFSDLEAEAQPASRFEWWPIAEADRLAAMPPHHSIIKITGTAYYVDDSGVRHWIRTPGLWNCATWNLGADSAVVRGWAASTLPLGDQFLCPN